VIHRLITTGTGRIENQVPGRVKIALRLAAALRTVANVIAGSLLTIVIVQAERILYRPSLDTKI
jgi:hypothetical protein